MSKTEKNDTVTLKKRVLLEILKNEILFGPPEERRFLKMIAEKKIERETYLVLFPKGLKDVALFFLEETINAIGKPIEKKQDIECKRSVPEKITQAILAQIRTEANFPVFFTHMSALLFVKSPFDALSAPFRMSDALWLALGDRSVDFNYYTKRIILAKIYAQTIHYALSDESENYHATEEYLNRLLRQQAKLATLINQFVNPEAIEEKTAMNVNFLFAPLSKELKRIFTFHKNV